MKMSVAEIILQAPDGWKVWSLGKQIAFLSPSAILPAREIIFTLRPDGTPIYKDYYEEGEFHREDGPAVTVYSQDGTVLEQLYYNRGTLIKKVIPKE